MDEPSILDYIKSKLLPWKYPPIAFPGVDTEAEPLISKSQSPETRKSPEREVVTLAETSLPLQEQTDESPEPKPISISVQPARHWPWRSLIALALALLAQYSLAPKPVRTWESGVVFLLLAIAFLVWANLQGEWLLVSPPKGASQVFASKVKTTSLITGLILSMLAFISFGSLQFGYLNLLFLLLALFFISLAFWTPVSNSLRQKMSFPKISADQKYYFSLSRPVIVTVAIVALAAFFRFYQLTLVPPEMNSDHAEKILDVLRILNGQTLIFFTNNGGREALQFYMAAAFHKLFGLPLGYTILKLVTVSVGFLSLPFIYLLGKEIGNRRVAMFAFLFAGIAYWPNVVSRVGLRLPFYILFTASTLYFLLRGIRTGRQNDFIFAGLSLGLSFYGYSADRILPLVILVAIALFLIHRQSKNMRKQTIFSLLALVLVSLVLFLPLLRFMLEEPQGFFFRTFSRMGNLERPIEGSVLSVFIHNVWNAMKMFSWSSGVVWPISIPDYPALGLVSGALFYLGSALLLVRYLRKCHWQDLFILVSIPLLMLPSILSLAFPDENPNLYRTGGALVPVFLIVGLALDGLLDGISSRLPGMLSRRLEWTLALVLIAFACIQNYHLVFNRYYEQYRMSAWNSSEMGAVTRDFVDTFGNADNIWVIGFPHWVDTRLVALNAGFPGRDLQIFVDQLSETASDPRTKLFILNPQDQPAIEALTQLYPRGWFQLFESAVETKDFLIFIDPPGNP